MTLTLISLPLPSSSKSRPRQGMQFQITHLRQTSKCMKFNKLIIYLSIFGIDGK